MKSFISKLSVLLFAAMFAVVGCQDYAEDIRQLNNKHNEDLSGINALIAELQSEIADLEKIAATHATKDELNALKEQLQGDIAAAKKAIEDAYKAADQALAQAHAADIQALQAELLAAKTQIETAIQGLQTTITNLNALITEVDQDLEALTKYVQEDLQATITTLENTLKAADLANQEAIAKVAADLLTAKTELAAKDAAIEASLNAAIDRISANETKIAEALARLTEAEADIEANKEAIEANEQAIAALKAAYEVKVAELVASIEEKAQAIAAEEQARKAADEELKILYTSADAVLKAELKNLITANTNKIATCEADIATLKTTVTELVNKVNALLADVEANKQSITAMGAAIDTLEDQVAELQSQVSQLATALRSVILVPETMHNGTKAVKFHRMEGENVLKTFAYVSFHFNPSNFDIASAEYEIVAENVEFRTKGLFDSNAAIEIVGTPVKDGDKVTFLLERAEGAGNMFALKVTLADGTTIYSEYAAILDEANYYEANATVSVELERYAFAMPSLNSLSDLINIIQGMGTAVEDFQAAIQAIGAAYEAIQAGDVYGALKELTSIAGFGKETVTITGVGYHKVKVETLDAETIMEDLMEAASLTDLMNQLQALIGKAEGLGGEQGAEIIEAIKNLASNNSLSDLMEKIEQAQEDFSIQEALRENAYAQLERSKQDLEDLKARLQEAIDNDKSFIEIGILEAAVWAGEEVVAGWEETLDGLVALVDQLEVKIKEYTDQLFEQTKDYIENSEFGQYIKQLENAIGEQGWNGRLLGAEIDAKAVASANALKDLTAQYNALNDEIVEEFKNSIFGKFLSIIESQEAIDAFEAIGLTQVHEALKLLPEIATLITKYYPKEITSIEGALSFLSSLTPEVTGGLTAPEYELVEYVPAE